MRHAPWAVYYLDYMLLKDLLEKDEPAGTTVDGNGNPNTKQISSRHRQQLLTQAFLVELDEQVERIVLFQLQQQGIIAASLQDHLAAVSAVDALVVVDAATRHKQLSTTQTQLHQTAVHLLQLVHYTGLNLTGIRKILKKHDRITRSRLTRTYLQSTVKNGNDHVLGPLLKDEAVQSLTVTLQHAWHALESQRDAAAANDKDEAVAVVRPSSTTTLLVLNDIAAARRRFQQQSSEFAVMLAAPMMINSDRSDSSFQQDLASSPRKPSKLSNTLNLLSTFFYMSNYYIVAPTSGSYAHKLGGSVSQSGLIIGMTSVAALISTVLYSWWTSHSYKSALLFASTCSLVGNLLYAMGLPCDSLTLVLWGRFLNGFGSARSINRRYVADTFSKEDRTAASAAFVTAGALGMAAGPAVAAALHLTVANPSNKYWQVENSVGWFMAVMWAGFLVCMIFGFEEPPRQPKETKSPTTATTATTTVQDVESLKGEMRPLLASQSTVSTVEDVNTPLWQNIPVMTTFLIYFSLKVVVETSLSSASNLSNFYFQWSTGFVGVYLAALGLLLLPANWVITYLARIYDDRELILGMLAAMVAGCFIIIQYTAEYSEFQYVIGTVILFVSATALEGPNMSLLSKTIPKRFRKGIFNVGLLATESGTFGRTFSDMMLTFWGSRVGIEHLLNCAFGSIALLGSGAIAVTIIYFDHLKTIHLDD